MQIDKISKLKKQVGASMVEYTVVLVGTAVILQSGTADLIVENILKFYSMFMVNLALPL